MQQLENLKFICGSYDTSVLASTAWDLFMGRTHPCGEGKPIIVVGVSVWGGC